MYDISKLRIRFSQQGIPAVNRSIGTLNTNLKHLRTTINSVTAASRRMNNANKSIGKAATTSVGKLGKFKSSFNSLEKSANKTRSAIMGVDRVSETLKNPTKKLAISSKAQSDIAAAGFTRTQRSANGLVGTLGELIRKYGTLFAVLGGIRGFQKAYVSATEMQENYNLVYQSFGKATQEVMRFQETLNSALGTNISHTLRTQGVFQALTRSLHIAQDSATVLSENLTKLMYDIASLYNISESRSSTILQSVLVGQTKPGRAVGIDVTQQSLQGYLDDILKATEYEGIRTVNLSQANKILLRYIAILEQTRIAQGDMAKTIESPANQLKVLKQQVAELSQAIGSVLIQMLGKVVVYVNAIVMVIKILVQALAGLLGFSLKDMQFGTAGADALEDLNDKVADTKKGFGGAAKAAKKMKKTLFGFDTIKNISLPSPTSRRGGGSGGFGVGVADGQDNIMDILEKNLKGYQNGMEDVRMKAVAIRDAILKAFGFQWITDDVTGKVKILGWRFSQMHNVIKAIVIALSSMLIYRALRRITENLILMTAAANAFLTTPSKMAVAFKTLGTNVRVLTPVILEGIKGWGASLVAFSSKFMSFSSGLPVVGGAVKALGATLGGLATTFALIAAGITAVVGFFHGFAVSIQSCVKSSGVLQSVGTSLSRTFGTLGNLVKSLAKLVGGIFKAAWSIITTVFKAVYAIAYAIGRVFGTLASVVGVVLTPVLNAVLVVLDLLARGLTLVVDALTWVFNGVGSLVTSFGDFLLGLVGINTATETTNENLGDMSTQLSMTKDEMEELKNTSSGTSTSMQSDFRNIFNGMSKSARDNIAKVTSASKRMWSDTVEVTQSTGEELKAMWADMNLAQRTEFTATYGIIKGLNEDWLDTTSGSADERRAKLKATLQLITQDESLGYDERKKLKDRYYRELLASNAEIITANTKRIRELKAKESELTEVEKLELNARQEQNKVAYQEMLEASNGNYDKIKRAFDEFGNEMKRKASRIARETSKNLKVDSAVTVKYTVTRKGTGGGNRGTVAMFAGGGFPNPENGLFFANSSELVGKFTNGRTAVANNEQITAGIYRAVSDAVAPMVQAVLNMGNQTLAIDGVEFGKVVMDSVDKTTLVTGKRFRSV